MSLRFGRPLVAIPGPSIMPERVLAAMRTPMPNIYAGELVEVTEEVFARLPSVARTSGHALAAIGNGHSGWEMAAANTLNRGDKVLVVETGRFPEVWGRFLTVSGVEIESLVGPERSAIDPALVQARLEAGPADEFAAVIAVQVDTAISVRNDIAALGAALDAYALDVGSYPSDLDSLVRAPAGAQRWDGPYLKKKQIPKDPWGNDFEYKTPNSGEYELSSRGPDGNSGGGDDISSSD